MPYKSHNPEETKNIAASMAAESKAGDIICLYGGLGAGKTAFAQGFAKGMGYGGEVTSPTFTLLHEYIGGRLPVYHFDLYRLSGGGQSADLESLGYDEYFYGNGVCLVEWPELAEALMPVNVRKITITPDFGKDAGYREIHDNTCD